MAHAAACKHSMGCHVSFVSMRVEVRVEQPQDVNTVLFPRSRGLLAAAQVLKQVENTTLDTTTQALQPSFN